MEVEGATVGEALNKLTAQHPDLRRHLYNDEGTTCPVPGSERAAEP